MDKPVRIGSAVILAVLVLGVLIDQRENVGELHRPTSGWPPRLFCAISLVTGYVVPRAAGVREEQAVASSMEIGVHNATLAIFVAVEVLDNTEISVPAAVYSIFMFVLAGLWGVLLTQRLAKTAQPAEAGLRSSSRSRGSWPAPAGSRSCRRRTPGSGPCRRRRRRWARRSGPSPTVRDGASRKARVIGRPVCREIR